MDAVIVSVLQSTGFLFFSRRYFLVMNKKNARTSVPLAALWRDRIVAHLREGLAHMADQTLPMARRVQKGRQAAKAARALLRLAPPSLKRKARATILALASARRRLGDSRDQDAIREAFAQIADRLSVTGRSRAALLRQIFKGDVAGPGAAADTLTEVGIVFERIVQQLERWKLPAGRDLVLLNAIADDYRRLKRDCRPGLDNLAVEPLHALRKRAIAHRHQLAFLAGLPHARSEKIAKRVERARKLHEAIGEHRDLELLTQHIASIAPPKSRGKYEKILVAVQQRQAKILKRAVRLAEKLTARPVKHYRASQVR